MKIRHFLQQHSQFKSELHLQHFESPVLRYEILCFAIKPINTTVRSTSLLIESFDNHLLTQS